MDDVSMSLLDEVLLLWRAVLRAPVNSNCITKHLQVRAFTHQDRTRIIMGHWTQCQLKKRNWLLFGDGNVCFARDAKPVRICHRATRPISHPLAVILVAPTPSATSHWLISRLSLSLGRFIAAALLASLDQLCARSLSPFSCRQWLWASFAIAANLLAHSSILQRAVRCTSMMSLQSSRWLPIAKVCLAQLAKRLSWLAASSSLESVCESDIRLYALASDYLARRIVPRVRQPKAVNRFKCT